MRKYAVITLIAVCFFSAENSNAGRHRRYRIRNEARVASTVEAPRSQSQLSLLQKSEFEKSTRKWINKNLEVECSLLESHGDPERIKVAADHLQKVIDLTRENLASSELNDKLQTYFEGFRVKQALRKAKVQHSFDKKGDKNKIYLDEDRAYLAKLPMGDYDENLQRLLSHYFNGKAFNLTTVGGSVGAHASVGGDIGLSVGGGKSILGKKYGAVAGRSFFQVGNVGPKVTLGGYEMNLPKGNKGFSRASSSDEYCLGMGTLVCAQVTAINEKEGLEIKGGEGGVGTGVTTLYAGGMRIWKKGLPFVGRDYKTLRKHLGIVPSRSTQFAVNS